MPKLNGWLWLAGIALFVPSQLQAQTSPARQAAANPADSKLRALYDGYAAWDAKESEQFEDSRGETKPTARLPKVDAQSLARTQVVETWVAGKKVWSRAPSAAPVERGK